MGENPSGSTRRKIKAAPTPKRRLLPSVRILVIASVLVLLAMALLHIVVMPVAFSSQPLSSTSGAAEDANSSSSSKFLSPSYSPSLTTPDEDEESSTARPSTPSPSTLSPSTLTPTTQIPTLVPTTIPKSSKVKKNKNVILIIADDLGIRDLGCYHPNNTKQQFYETPHLDRFASESVLFEHAYSAYATCAESRAGIYTGMYPSRLGIVDFQRLRGLGYRQEWKCLRRADGHGRGLQKVPLDAETLPKAFGRHGYRTALIGKWHSGTETLGLPHQHGFDIVIGNRTGLPTHFAPYQCGERICRTPPSNLTLQVPNGTMMAEHLAMETLNLIQHEFQNGTTQAPFFLTLAHYAVHTPIEATMQDLNHFKRKRKLMNESGTPVDVYLTIDGLIERQTQDSSLYAGLLKSLDDSMGTLLQGLHNLGLENNTIVLFASDNGGKSCNWNWAKAKAAKTSNLPYKTGKEFMGDGGLRVPLIIRAPGIPPRRVTQFQSHGVDYFATLLDLAGLPLQPADHVDGVSLVPAMLGHVTQRGTPMFWQKGSECFYDPNSTHPQGRNCTETSYAVIWDEWKLLQRVYSEMHDRDSTFELYHIEADPGEHVNLVHNASAAAQLVALQQSLQHWKDTWFQTAYFDRLRTLYNNCT